MEKEFKGLSIKYKLLLFSLCIALIPIALITAIYFVNARDTLKKQTLDWLTAVAESKKIHILTYIESKKERAIDFSFDGLIIGNLDKVYRGESLSDEESTALKNHLLKYEKSIDPYIVAITVVGMDGQVVATTDERLMDHNLSEEEVFTQVTGKNRVNSYVDATPRYFPHFEKNGIFISAPIASNTGANTVGVIIITYDLKILSKITTNRVGMGKTGEVVIGKKVGNEVVFLNSLRYAPDTPLSLPITMETTEAMPMKLALKGKNGTTLANDYRDVEVIAAFQYFAPLDWGLVAKIDKAEAFASIRTAGIIAIVIGFTCAVAVTGFGIIFATSTARPINKLKFATERFKDGDLKYRAKIDRRDEIGLLAFSFNDMAETLGKKITEHQHAEDGLQESEQHFRELAENIGEVFWMQSADKKEMLYVSPAYEQIWGRTCKSLYENLNSWFDAIHPDDRRHVADNFSQWQMRDAFTEEYRVVRPDGEIRWILDRGFPIRNKSGEIYRIAGIAADITEHKKEEETLKKTIEERNDSIRDLRGLMDFSTFINEETQEEVLLKYMVMTLKERFNPDILAVLTLDSEKNLLDATLIDPPMPAEELLKEEILINPSLCRVIRTGKELVVTDFNEGSLCECIHCDEVGSYVCFPLIAGGSVIGMVILIKREKGYWDTKKMRRLMSTYIGLTTSALLKVRLMAITRQTAITDSLTGIYNRRFFDEMLQKQFALAERRNESLSLLIVDLDHFKDFNDTYGHTIGDRALQEMASIMSASIRSSDVLTRYGGEEFAIIMPATDVNNAIEKAESLRLHVESNNFNNLVPGKTFNMTISIGVASSPKHGNKPATLISAADKALYKAKDGGRNRVESP